MKKLLTILFAVILILQAGMITATAESLEKEKLMITASKMALAVLAAMPDAKTPETTQSASEDLVLSGQDIAVEDGKYSYLFRLRPNGTLVFDNQLERKYQGIDDNYRLHYDIDETDCHTMIVAGDFDRVITESPLLKILPAENRNRLLSKISEDSYSYQLALKTENELTFTNSLSFLYDSDQHGFSIDYRYDIPANKNTVKFSVSDATEQTIRTAFMKATEYLKSLLPGN
jgi:hypothetical protein